MIKYEGIFSFYKGVSLPIITFLPKNTVCFTFTNYL